MERQNLDQIKENIIYLYNKIKEESKLDITEVTFYEDLVLINEKGNRMGIAEQNIYSVQINTGDEKIIYKLYCIDEKDNEKTVILIADIDEKKLLSLSEEYIQILYKADSRFKEIIEKSNKKEKIQFPNEKTQGKNEKQEDNYEYRILKMNSDEIDPQKDKNEKQEINDEEKVAEIVGIKESDINSCVTIDPDTKVTDEDTFANAFDISDGQYEKIYVVYTGNTAENKRFEFVGITHDGLAERLDSIESINRFQSQDKILRINRDGSTIEEESVMEGFYSKNNNNKGLSVTLGQYGVPEITYTRKDQTDNQGAPIAIPVETCHVRPTTLEVLKFMNDRRNNNAELQESLDKTKEQISENESNKTNLSQIDKYVDNDKGYDVDEEITLHDESVTTLRREALKYGVSVEEYKNEIENTEGDCVSSKIEIVSKKHQEEQKKENVDERENAHEQREIESIEEAALRRLHSSLFHNN